MSLSIKAEDLLAIAEKLQWPGEFINLLIRDLEVLKKDQKSCQQIHLFQSEFGINLDVIKNVVAFQKETTACPDTFLLFCVVAIVPKMLNEYRRHNIPEEFAWAILNDVIIWSNDYRKKKGRWGFDTFNWVSNHLALRIFQIKGFQFEPKEFNLPFYIFQNYANKQLLILCQSGLLCNHEGLIFDKLEAEQIRNTTSFQMGSAQFSGYEVNGKGYVSAEKKTWLLKDWQLITKPNDPYLCFHIPEGSRLTLENLNGAFENANLFFAKYFPEFQYKVFATKSWIFDDQIAAYLPESNFAKFQKCVHLLPVLNGNEEQFLERVFGDIKVDWKHFKPVTQLQKIGLLHLEAGKNWHIKSFVLHKEDLPLNDKYF